MAEEGEPDHVWRAVFLLQSLGWHCEPPFEFGKTFPEPEAGQTWVTSKFRTKRRRIVRVGPRWGTEGDVCVFHNDPDDDEPHQIQSWCSVRSFKKWAERAWARPMLIK